MALLDLLLKSSLLLALGALVVYLRQRGAAAHRHFVWTLVMTGLLVLPVLINVVPRLPVLPMLWSRRRLRRRAGWLIRRPRSAPRPLARTRRTLRRRSGSAKCPGRAS